MTEKQKQTLFNFIQDHAFQIRTSDNPKALSKHSFNIEDVEFITSLHFWNKNLTYLPDEICLLQHLRVLKLTKNKLTQLPRNFALLTSLEELDLSDNLLAEFPESICTLPNLTILNLDKNYFRYLPESITNLKIDDFYVSRWVLHNNFIEPAPEIIMNGLETIKVYFDSIRENMTSLKELKILVVGDGGAGKTQLINRLINNTFHTESDSTHGIEIKNVNINDIKVNVWDFGGQELMHQTHQFFLTKRSLYILVLDSRREDNEEYWLKMIESFSGNSPIMIVLNKIDESPSFELDRKHLLQKYQNIKGFYRISCKTAEGLDQFQCDLNTFLSDIELVDMKFPTTWLSVKDHVEGLKEDFINYSDFQKICDEHHVLEPKQQKALIRILHDLGLVLNFDSDSRLQDTNVINPLWATSAVYGIINSPIIIGKTGKFKLSDLVAILDSTSYPVSKHIFIVDLMKKFNLLYELESSREYLIPELLPKIEPDIKLNFNKAHQFRYKFDFFQKSIIATFIVVMNDSIHENTVWRNGVLLKIEECFVLVKADPEDRFIEINSIGVGIRDALSVIRFNIKKIIDTFTKLNYEEIIIIENDFNQKEYIPYKRVKVYADRGEAILISDEGNEYTIAKLLSDIELRNEREPFMNNTKIVINQSTIHGSAIGINNNVMSQEEQVNKGLANLCQLLKDHNIPNHEELKEKLMNVKNDKTNLTTALSSVLTQTANIGTITQTILSLLSLINQ